MNRTIETWSVQKILNLLYRYKLNYKPNIQRQFVYKPEQQEQVIVSIKKGFVASSLVVEMEAPGSYVLLDGKQRVNSIIGFINRSFTVDGFYFDDRYRLDRLNNQDRYLCPQIIETELDAADNSDTATLLKFEFPVVVYSDLTKEERLTLFNVINTSIWFKRNEKLEQNNQELCEECCKLREIIKLYEKALKLAIDAIHCCCEHNTCSYRTMCKGNCKETFLAQARVEEVKQ